MDAVGSGNKRPTEKSEQKTKEKQHTVSRILPVRPFRAGVDISGSLEKMKFRITKAKYKDLFIPSRKAKVDSAQLNLRQRIRTLLREGGNNELN